MDRLATYLNKTTNQFQNFAALMQNFGHATEATATAIDSAGSAAKENSRYMESLEARTSSVKATFQELANNVINSELVKSMLDLANATLQLANTPIGNFVTQMGLLTGVLWGGSSLIKAMNILPAAFGTLTKMITGASTATSIFGGVLKASFPQMLIISGVLTALYTGYNLLKTAWDEAHPSIEELNQEINDNSTALEENKKRLEELNKIPYSSRTSEINKEIEALEKSNEVLNESIEKYRQQKAEAELSALRENESYRTSDTGYTITSPTFSFSANSIEEFTRQLEMMEGVSEEARGQVELINETLASTNGIVTDDVREEFELLLRLLQDDGAEIGEFEANIKSFDDSMSEMTKEYGELSQKIENNIELTADEKARFQELQSVLGEVYQQLNNAKEGNAELSDAEIEVYSQLSKLVPKFEELEFQMWNTVDGVKATDVYLGQLSAGMALNKSQVDVLTAVYPGLSSALEENNGMYQLNIAALYEASEAGNVWASNVIAQQKAATEAAIKYTQLRIDAAVAEAKKAGIEFGYSSEEYKRQRDIAAQLLAESHELQYALNRMEAGYSPLPYTPKKQISIITGGEDEGSGSSSSSASKTNDILEERKDIYTEQLAILEHQLFLMEKQGATEQERIAMNKKIQDYLHEQAEWYRAQGVDENSEYIRDLQEQWWSYQDTIESIYDDIEKKAQETAEAIRQATIEALQTEQDELSDLFSAIANQAQKEIDKLEADKQAIEDKYQAQIDALEETNDEIERQLELEQALDDLAKARQTKVMVYKDGRFQYVQDIDQVSEAQANLDKVQREEALRQEIENLEELRDKEIAAIDDQIAKWQEYVDKYGDFVDELNEQQAIRLLEQKYGIKLEGENWELSLSNLEDYVNRYIALMKQLEVYEKMEDVAEDVADIGGSIAGSIAGSMNSSNKDYSQIWWDAENAYQSGQMSKEEADKIKDWAHSQKQEEMAGTGSVFNPNTGTWERYANGTLSAKGGLSLVGENGPELRIMGQGEGVIPANITKNLWEWGKMSPYSLFNNSDMKNQTTNVSIGNITLPNVQNAQDFVEALRSNFWRKTLQFQST